jgi:hypothetical protein
MKASCGCEVGPVKAVALWVCVFLRWFRLFDKIHGNVGKGV